MKEIGFLKFICESNLAEDKFEITVMIFEQKIK